MSSRLLVAVSYLALMTGWIYGVLNTNPAGDIGWSLPFVALIQIALGFALGRWWAAIIPLATVIIAVPAGDPEITPSNAEPFPIFSALRSVRSSQSRSCWPA